MIISSISNKNIKPSEAIKASDIRESLLSFIQKNHPEFSSEGYLSYEELNFFRRLYITELVIQEKGELAKIDEDVVEAIRSNAVLSENIEDKIDEELTFGQRMADLIATFGGSWVFIISFFLFLFGWILLNALFLGDHPYDRYPFILLNLILSCIAALQAPIIMMSQNRLEEKDRSRAKKDFIINLKAEQEIRVLQQKMDQILKHQHEELMAIQQQQIQLMEQIIREQHK